MSQTSNFDLRPCFTVLVALGLAAAPGCFNKQNQAGTETPGEQEGGSGEASGEATGPSRAAPASGTTRVSRAGGRIKSFEAPKEPRTELVVALPPQVGADLSVTEVRPSMAAAGSQVEIFGTGFLEAAADNKVSSGGTAWQVVEVYGDRIVAVVPQGAGSGNVEVAAGAGKGSTTNSFTALGGDDAFEQASANLSGLVGTVYEMSEASDDMPDFSSLSAKGTIALPTLNIGTTAASDFESGLSNYAIRFAGSLNVNAEGEYELCLNSDDGSRLLLMDTLVVDNGGVHEATEACELVYLEAGEYDVAIEYQNAASTPNVALSFTWAKDGGEKVPVPAGALFRP